MCIHGGEGDWHRNKKAEEDKQREQKYVRGTKIPVRKEKNSTLKNKIRYQEKLIKDAVEGTAKLEKWLLPGGAGYIEAEGNYFLFEVSCESVWLMPGIQWVLSSFRCARG